MLKHPVDKVFGALTCWLRFRPQLKVFNPVVGFDPVFVVDVFKSFKFAAVVKLPNNSMLLNKTCIQITDYIAMIIHLPFNIFKSGSPFPFALGQIKINFISHPVVMQLAIAMSHMGTETLRYRANTSLVFSLRLCGGITIFFEFSIMNATKSPTVKLQFAVVDATGLCLGGHWWHLRVRR
jgi:hypothetical protein